MDSSDVSWFENQFPDLANVGYTAKISALVAKYPPGTDIKDWTSGDLSGLLTTLGCEDLVEPLKEQEFLSDDVSEETPFSEVTPEELDELLEDSDSNMREALKVALRYLKGEFTNVSLRA
mmetsp:Transcript_36084/g.62499  ORF Transcript_36084/g.62499 Transcript_36084/m.62499 type:complete len:120 (+) Transcript_36084:128-487(+)